LKIVRDPTCDAKFLLLGMMPRGLAGGAHGDHQGRHRQWAKVIKDAGIKPAE